MGELIFEQLDFVLGVSHVETSVEVLGEASVAEGVEIEGVDDETGVFVVEVDELRGIGGLFLEFVVKAVQLFFDEGNALLFVGVRDLHFKREFPQKADQLLGLLDEVSLEQDLLDRLRDQLFGRTPNLNLVLVLQEQSLLVEGKDLDFSLDYLLEVLDALDAVLDFLSSVLLEPPNDLVQNVEEVDLVQKLEDFQNDQPFPPGDVQPHFLLVSVLVQVNFLDVLLDQYHFSVYVPLLLDVQGLREHCVEVVLSVVLLGQEELFFDVFSIGVVHLRVDVPLGVGVGVLGLRLHFAVLQLLPQVVDEHLLVSDAQLPLEKLL